MTATPLVMPEMEEREQIDALANALRWGQGFKLIFARCYSSEQRQRLTALLRERLHALNIQEIVFHQPLTHLLDALRGQISEPPPEALFVSGLEHSLPIATEAPYSPFVLNLNASRNSFPLVITCPLVLWVPDYILNAIFQGAPDFFSVRSGVYYFPAQIQETANIAGFMLEGEEWEAANLSAEAKRERIATIEGLLRDYQMLPEAKRDLRTEALLWNRLANLYTTLRQWEKAENALLAVLQITRDLKTKKEEAIALFHIGSFYQEQERSEEAIETFQEGLTIAQEIEDQSLIAVAHYHLSGTYLKKNFLLQAEASIEKGLKYARSAHSKEIELGLLLNLSSIYHQQKRNNLVEECVREILSLSRETGAHRSELQAYYSLSQLQLTQNRLEEAEQTALRCVALARELQDRLGIGFMLSNLGMIYERQGRAYEALEVYVESTQIYAELGFVEYELQDLHNQISVQEGLGNTEAVKELQAKIEEIRKNQRDRKERE